MEVWSLPDLQRWIVDAFAERAHRSDSLDIAVTVGPALGGVGAAAARRSLVAVLAAALSCSRTGCGNPALDWAAVVRAEPVAVPADGVRPGSAEGVSASWSA